MTQSVLSFDSVTKRYRTGDFWRPRRGVGLDGVSFELLPGEVFGLLGLNGAGKTTLMKTAVGLLRPDQGQVRLFGMDPRERSARARFGYLPELPYFPGYLSSREVLTYYAQLHGMGREQARARVSAVLVTVGLSAAADEPIRNYSKGMQQRVGLGQTLLHDPELLFLDEPLSGLDPRGMKEMRDVILAQKTAGKTVFFNSHTLAEVERVCDRVGIMYRGRMILVSPVAQLLAERGQHAALGSSPLESAFLSVIDEADHA